MVRRHFARYVHAALSSRRHHPGGFFRGHVRDMPRLSRIRGQQKIACDDRVFGNCGTAAQPHARCGRPFAHDSIAFEQLILTVNDEAAANFSRSECSIAHHPRIHYRAAVIAECHGSASCKLREIHRVNALAANGDSRYWVDAASRALGPRNVCNQFGRVDCRIRIRHCRDRGESAGDSRCRSACHRLLFRVPGIAKMNVHVDESRCYVSALRIQHAFAGFGLEIPADLHDSPGAHAQIPDRVQVCGRIDDTSPLNQHPLR